MNIRDWMNQQKTTTAELAERLNVDRGHLAGIITGKRTASLNLAQQLEEVTGISAYDIMLKRACERPGQFRYRKTPVRRKKSIKKLSEMIVLT